MERQAPSSRTDLNLPEIAKDLLIRLFQEEIKGNILVGTNDLERHFSSRIDSQELGRCVKGLEEQGLLEQATGPYRDRLKLTREGIRVGYNLHEYDLQIVVNDICASYEPLGRLGITASSTVLDIGCGAGQTLVAICRQANPRLAVGIDIEKNNLSFARCQSSRYLHAQSNSCFLAASAHDLPFRDNSFTHIIFRQALYLVDVDRAMAELSRLLHPDGVAYIRVPSWNHALGYLRRKGLKNTFRGLFVLSNGIVFHFLGRQLGFYVRSYSTHYRELFFTRNAIEQLCRRHQMATAVVPTPRSKGGIMMLVRRQRDTTTAITGTTPVRDETPHN